MKIILGSGSKSRRDLIKEWGLEFDFASPDIDEKSIITDDFRKRPNVLAQAKSLTLQDMIKEPAILITCDTVVVYKGNLYEKPKNSEEAREYLQSYGEGPVEVICGLTVHNTATGQTISGTDTAKVYFHRIPHRLIEDMISHGRVYDWAGAFHPDDPATKPYIVHIEGDMGTVKGLPQMLMKKLIDEVQND